VIRHHQGRVRRNERRRARRRAHSSSSSPDLHGGSAGVGAVKVATRPSPRLRLGDSPAVRRGAPLKSGEEESVVSEPAPVAVHSRRGVRRSGRGGRRSVAWGSWPCNHSPAHTATIRSSCTAGPPTPRIVGAGRANARSQPRTGARRAIPSVGDGAMPATSAFRSSACPIAFAQARQRSTEQGQQPERSLAVCPPTCPWHGFNSAFAGRVAAASADARRSHMRARSLAPQPCARLIRHGLSTIRKQLLALPPARHPPQLMP